MKSKLIIAISIAALASTSAYAINAKYRQKLERSGCTQVSESQGCDLTKTKAENAKAGFVNEASPYNDSAITPSPYAGQWVAKNKEGLLVAKIQIDSNENVVVNGKKIKAKRSDGALVFKDGFMTYAIQGDRRLKGESYWVDSDAKTKGVIEPE